MTDLTSTMQNSPHNKPVIGIDVGGTNMQFGVVDAGNAIIGRAAAKTEAACRAAPRKRCQEPFLGSNQATGTHL